MANDRTCLTMLVTSIVFAIEISAVATPSCDICITNMTGDGDTGHCGAGKEATIFGETCVTFGNNSALFKYFAKCLLLFACIYQK